jgi:hypothetical protein
VERFHRDIHDGEEMPPYVPDGDNNRDISTISVNAPDFMHIPGIPLLKAKYRRGGGSRGGPALVKRRECVAAF